MLNEEGERKKGKGTTVEERKNPTGDLCRKKKKVRNRWKDPSREEPVTTLVVSL